MENHFLNQFLFLYITYIHVCVWLQFQAQQKEKVLRYQEEKRKIAAQESLEAAREHLDELERKRTATRLLKHYQERVCIITIQVE